MKNERGAKSKHVLYQCYKGLLYRCNNPKAKAYQRYGGRGIKICKRWLGAEGFWAFVEDMGERPEGKGLDRIDNDGGYNPDNCRWATLIQQARNKRNSRYVLFCGEYLNLVEAAKMAGIGKSTFWYRLKSGWDYSTNSVGIPPVGWSSRRVDVIYKGVEMNLKTACSLSKVNYSTVRARLKAGWDKTEALTKEARSKSG